MFCGEPGSRACHLQRLLSWIFNAICRSPCPASGTTACPQGVSRPYFSRQPEGVLVIAIPMILEALGRPVAVSAGWAALRNGQGPDQARRAATGDRAVVGVGAGRAAV